MVPLPSAAFGELLDNVSIRPVRFHTVYSIAVDRGLTGVVGVELKLGYIDRRGRRIPKAMYQEIRDLLSPSRSRFITGWVAFARLGRGRQRIGCPFRRLYAWIPCPPAAFTPVYGSHSCIHARIVHVACVRRRNLRPRTRLPTAARRTRGVKGYHPTVRWYLA